MTGTEDKPEGGGVPNAYRNAVFWRWSREMPRALPKAMLTAMYALGAAADTKGRVRFNNESGQPIRLSDIAKAIGCDEKDARRYLTALIAAGVLDVEGERKRGKRPTYVLLLCPRPDWQAAVDSLKSTERKRPTRRTPAPWEREQGGTENGGQTPELDPSTSGVCPPNFIGGDGDENGGQTPDRERGADPREVRGADPGTNQEDQEVPQDMAGVGDQPSGVAHARESDEQDHSRYLDGLPMGGRPYRAAARRYFEGLGIEPTPEQIDAHAYAAATRPQLRVVGS